MLTLRLTMGVIAGVQALSAMTGFAAAAPGRQDSSNVAVVEDREARPVELAQATDPQRPSPRRTAQETFNETRERVNANTVTIISGSHGGTFLRVAADIATVLSDDNELRVLAMIGGGGLQNARDIVFLRGVDLGIVRSDVLAYYERTGEIPNVRNHIRYITRLFYDEVHLIARKEIRTIQDLQGKRVNLDQKGSSANVLGTLVFDALGITIDSTTDDVATALEKMKTGEVVATFDITSAPSKDVAALKPESGFHILPIPYTDKISEIYLPASFSNEQYPNLIPQGEQLQTLAVPSVLAVYNWPVDSDRYRRLEKFTKAFFEKFDQFHKPPRHPKWKDVQPEIDLPGWTRFQPAAEAVMRLTGGRRELNEAKIRADFQTFMKSIGSSEAKLSAQDEERLFRNFMKWWQQQR